MSNMYTKAFTVIFTTVPEYSQLLNAAGIYTLLANTVNHTNIMVKGVIDNNAPEIPNPDYMSKIGLIKKLREEYGISLVIAKSMADAAQKHGDYVISTKVITRHITGDGVFYTLEYRY